MTNTARDSLASIRKKARLQALSAKLEIICNAYDDYDFFVEYIEDEVYKAISFVESNANRINFDLSEDQLTLYLIANLNDEESGVYAMHEINERGHCDITIKIGNHRWLAEAKKHKNYEYLLKGYKQLTERYTTGVSSKHGAVIIYNKNRNVSSLMSKWKEYLLENAINFQDGLWAEECKNSDFDDNLSAVDCEKRTLTFISQHIHTISGEPYKTRHMPVCLYHSPLE